jgi:hypothetical protein
MRITLQHHRHDGAEHDVVDEPSNGLNAISPAPLDSLSPGELHDGRS